MPSEAASPKRIEWSAVTLSTERSVYIDIDILQCQKKRRLHVIPMIKTINKYVERPNKVELFIFLLVLRSPPIEIIHSFVQLVMLHGLLLKSIVCLFRLQSFKQWCALNVELSSHLSNHPIERNFLLLIV